ncbi:hypothetical protein ACFV0R_25710 [Streptomyces sp. NPDC059578]|uniref:hypothetical protein n=1 Tax=Streptomyces sp. NPDC059578 TaxID=3346874 RepID=UPI0036A73B95
MVHPSLPYARAARHRAARALTTLGSAHPRALRLLAIAAGAAARAWDHGHRVADTHPAPFHWRRRKEPLPTLYELYMAADRAHRAHHAVCGRCTADHPDCPAGRQLHDEFVQRQDAYLAAQKKRRP